MTEQDLINLLNQPNHEHEHLEFKEAKTQYSVMGDGNNRNSIYAYCVGIGNSGGGKLLLGVKDDKTIVGITWPTNINDIKSNIYSKMKLNIKCHHIVTSDGKRVLVIDIPARRAGILFKFYNVPLTRVGEELIAMEDDEIKNVLNEVSVDWSGQPVEGATFDDIDIEAVVKAKQNFAKKNPNIPKEEIDSWSVEQFLECAKILNNGRITNAALILLGKEASKNLLAPYVAQISWVLCNEDNDTIDYEHFYMPFILSVDKVFAKIRNLKQRYIIGNNSLFPEEVDQYEPFVIREALHNCIAHQDYSEKAKITVVEKPDKLVFANSGKFIPKTIENVIDTDTPPRIYRNPFLANAMVSLNMIDTVGSGIKRMFKMQRNRFFPLPTYDLENKEVKVEIFGKIIDINYARILAENTKMSLEDIRLLDNVQKKIQINHSDANRLRRMGFIEGRYPSIHISASVAEKTNSKADYIKNRGLNTGYYEKLVVEYLKQFGSAGRKALDELLLDKLPDVLSDIQKDRKVGNILFAMSKKELIVSTGLGRKSVWKLNISDRIKN